MKTPFSSKTMIALAVAIAAAAAIETEANEQPIPPPSSEMTLPQGVSPGSPAAQVIKLVQAGVDASVIQVYISNCPSAFNLDADKIIALTDAGLPNDLVNQMFDHDKRFLSSLPTSAATPPPTASPPAPVIASAPPPAEPPPTEVTVNNFYQNLSPYGSWVEVDGYGRCWRPNVVVYDSGWRPYCDRGRWVYTDCGWYWDSDYSWGVTFHYGRWFNNPSYGWCWWPDTVWAPSWVTWRSSTEYCGWAPLPPYTVYNPGVGFCYRGNNVAVSFDFGLSANCFNFVSIGNFCQPQPRQHCVPPQQVNNFYNSTVVINNFNCKQKNICNDGVSVTVIGQSARRTIPTVPVHSMGGRHGGGGSPFRYFGTDTSDIRQNQQLADGSARQISPDKGNDNRDNRFNHRPSIPDGNTTTTATSRQNPSQNWDVLTTANRKPIKLADANTASQPVAPVKVSDGRNGRDLIIAGHGNNNFSRPNVSFGSQTPVNTPAQDLQRGRSGLGGFNPQPTKPAAPVVSTPPVVTTTPTPANNSNKGWANATARSNQRTDIPTPSRSFNQPAAASPAPFAIAERQQRNESRQNFSQPAPRSTPVMPAPANIKTTAPASQNNGDNMNNVRFQNWLAQGR